jgi:hypothetical protein
VSALTNHRKLLDQIHNDTKTQAILDGRIEEIKALKVDMFTKELLLNICAVHRHSIKEASTLKIEGTRGGVPYDQL